MGLGTAVSGTPALVVAVVAWVALSLAASSVLIVRLERIGARIGLTEASLGLLAALAADTPEITSAVTALSRGQRDIGVGVVIGSNVFNLAALLGLGAVVAGGIRLRRPVVLVEGAVGIWLALVALAVLVGHVPPAIGLAAALAVFVPYAVVSALRPAHRATLLLPARIRALVVTGVAESEQDMSAAERDLAAIPGRRVAGRRDVVHALLAVLVVILASAEMERTLTELGSRWHVSSAIVGAVVLAAVTSLPNAVAAVYLARRGRGSATLSEAMNSNTINTVVGFLVPATLIGIGTVSTASRTVGLWYAGLTAATLVTAYILRAIPRVAGYLVIAAYVVFVLLLAATT
jgi:cation:H+ antiporter